MLSMEANQRFTARSTLTSMRPWPPSICNVRRHVKVTSDHGVLGRQHGSSWIATLRKPAAVPQTCRYRPAGRQEATVCAAGLNGVPQAEKKQKIVFVSAEVSPWSKTGGLGDVVGGLPVALAKRGHQCISIAPRCAVPNGYLHSSYLSFLTYGVNCPTKQLARCTSADVQCNPLAKGHIVKMNCLPGKSHRWDTSIHIQLKRKYEHGKMQGQHARFHPVQSQGDMLICR